MPLEAVVALLTRYPNNEAIQSKLRHFGVDPDITHWSIDPNRIDPGQWEPWEIDAGRRRHFAGTLGRPKVMEYVYGFPTALTAAVVNSTQDPIERTLTGEKTIGTETSLSISTTIEAGFFGSVSLSVTTAFSQTWKKEEKFTDSIRVTIRPGRMMWLELIPVMRRIDGDFVHFRRWHTETRTNVWQFSGVVEAPGLEGGLRDVVNVRDEPVSKEMADLFQAASVSGSGEITTDGTLVTLPGNMAASLTEETRES
ncbi:hypothetical protein [Streptomyces kronopolitis]|uniref:hypothetical protein n=1 Tax=Streptomyces kronopolitis TaxID=1612435 RepID=UPI00342FA034